MTTQTLSTRPSDPSIPYPALHHDGDYTWKPAKRTGSILIGLATLLGFGAATVWLQFISEDAYAIEFNRIVTIPAVLITAVGAVIGLILLIAAFRPLAPWFQDWSYLEVLEKEEGLRVYAGRLGADHVGLLVRRGDVLEITGSRGDSLDEAELVVKASTGTLSVDVDVFLTSLDIKPLEQAAARYDIELRLSGVATEIPRTPAA